MCTLCLSDMGELRDEWLREPKPAAAPSGGTGTAAPVPPALGRLAGAAPADRRLLADRVVA